MQIKGSAYIVDLTRPEALPSETRASNSAQRGRGAGQRSLDQVDISSGSPSLEQLKKDLDALPDLRMDRVALARQTLQDGGYRVAPSVVAEKMLEAFGA